MWKFHSFLEVKRLRDNPHTKSLLKIRTKVDSKEEVGFANPARNSENRGGSKKSVCFADVLSFLLQRRRHF